MYSKKIDIRWSDLDPNFHVLHSKYYDFCAFARTAYLYENNITAEVMVAQGIGPILFREECIFRKEIKFGDAVMVKVFLAAATRNFARWSFAHEIWIGEDVLAAKLNVDGAWMDMRTRKLTTPSQEVLDVFEAAEKTDDFKFL